MIVEVHMWGISCLLHVAGGHVVMSVDRGAREGPDIFGDLFLSLAGLQCCDSVQILVCCVRTTWVDTWYASRISAYDMILRGDFCDYTTRVKIISLTLFQVYQ